MVRYRLGCYYTCWEMKLDCEAGPFTIGMGGGMLKIEYWRKLVRKDHAGVMFCALSTRCHHADDEGIFLFS